MTALQPSAVSGEDATKIDEAYNIVMEHCDGLVMTVDAAKYLRKAALASLPTVQWPSISEEELIGIINGAYWLHCTGDSKDKDPSPVIARALLAHVNRGK